VRVVAFLTIAVITLSWVERTRNADEEYAVYSAYLSYGLLNDAHDWSAGPPIQVVIEDTTRIGANLRWWRLYPLDGRVRFDQLYKSTRASFIVRNLLRTRLQPKFHLPSRAKVAFTSISVDSPDFRMKYPNIMGLVRLSGVGFDTGHVQAVFYIDHLCGLCGGGRYVLMEKINGSWRVKDEPYTWIS
jgi:hypothetical protein